MNHIYRQVNSQSSPVSAEYGDIKILKDGTICIYSNNQTWIECAKISHTHDDRYYTETEVTALLNDKVDKVPDKGLSTNDYTTADKTKLAGIIEGAEPNVQSNWAQTDTTADDYIKNKPTIPTKLSQLTTDSTHRVVTDAEKSTWDNKQAPITGGASTVTSTDLEINKALISNGGGKIAVSNTTSTELGYLHGVTSNVQTQLNDKLANNISGTITGNSTYPLTICSNNAEWAYIPFKLYTSTKRGSLGVIKLADGTYVPSFEDSDDEDHPLATRDWVNSQGYLKSIISGKCYSVRGSSSSQTLSTGTITTVTLSTSGEITKSDSSFTISNGGIKCPYTGNIMVSGNVYFSSQGGTYFVYIYKNNTEVVSNSGARTGGYFAASSGFAIISVTANDVIYLKARSMTAAGAVQPDNSATHLDVVYI